MRKHSDGYYYEKITTWDKKPNYFLIILSIIMVIIGCLYFYHVTKSEVNIPVLKELGYLKTMDVMALIVGVIVLMVGGITGGIFLFIYSLGYNKKTKYKRIGE